MAGTSRAVVEECMAPTPASDLPKAILQDVSLGSGPLASLNVKQTQLAAATAHACISSRTLPSPLATPTICPYSSWSPYRTAGRWCSRTVSALCPRACAVARSRRPPHVRRSPLKMAASPCGGGWDWLLLLLRLRVLRDERRLYLPARDDDQREDALPFS